MPTVLLLSLWSMPQVCTAVVLLFFPVLCLFSTVYCSHQELLTFISYFYLAWLLLGISIISLSHSPQLFSYPQTLSLFILSMTVVIYVVLATLCHLQAATNVVLPRHQMSTSPE